MLDVLVVGTGPAGIAISAALCDAGLQVEGVSPAAPDVPWANTYGIWVDEVAPLALTGMLGRRWSDCVAFAGERRVELQRDYGLFDNSRLQAHLLARAQAGGMVWHRGHVAQAVHHAYHTELTTHEGGSYAARLVVDASGHNPVLLQRPRVERISYQAAYGIVGRFSAPPVAPGQMVLMDYRSNHLGTHDLQQPPTFLYAMDLGQDRYFVEETSLAHAPAVAIDVLEGLLHQRLARQGIRVEEIEHVERVLFPMDLPLPWLTQPVLGYGAAASMVHPISGYQVGAALRYAAPVAQAIAVALETGRTSPGALARAGWEALWPQDRWRRRHLYLFGLANVLRFNVRQTQDFFAAFFNLPRNQWAGYLSDTLTTPQLLAAMWNLFVHAPNHVRRSLLTSVWSAEAGFWRANK